MLAFFQPCAPLNHALRYLLDKLDTDKAYIHSLGIPRLSVCKPPPRTSNNTVSESKIINRVWLQHVTGGHGKVFCIKQYVLSLFRHT